MNKGDNKMLPNKIIIGTPLVNLSLLVVGE